MKYQIWECTRAECRLRFPVGLDEIHDLDWTGTCPRCRAPVRICDEYDAAGEETLVHVPAGSPARYSGFPFHALLDNLRSARNVGAIFRTADGVGIQHLYLCGITPPPEHPHAAAAALGAHKVLAYSRHANALDILQEKKDRGWLLWALECGDIAQCPTFPLEDAAGELRKRVAQDADLKFLLVVGSERYGVDPECLETCDAALWIPMHGRKGSFNAATAFGIAAYVLNSAIHRSS